MSEGAESVFEGLGAFGHATSIPPHIQVAPSYGVTLDTDHLIDTSCFV